MATVPNLAYVGGPTGTGLSPAVDVSYAKHSRTLAASPVGTTTPAFIGEIILDTANNTYWRAAELTSSSWVPTVVQA